MDDETKASLAAAMAGGYILGRTKKGRLALTTIAFLFGRRMGAEPGQLVAEGVRRLREVPQVSELEEQVKTEGLKTARKALSSVVGRGVESVTGGIGSRLPGLGAEEKEEKEEKEETKEGEESEETREKPARRRRRDAEGSEGRAEKSSRSGAKKTSPARAADRTAPAKKKTAERAAPARRAASSSTGKAAASKRTARSAASRTTRSDARPGKRR